MTAPAALHPKDVVLECGLPLAYHPGAHVLISTLAFVISGFERRTVGENEAADMARAAGLNVSRIELLAGNSDFGIRDFRLADERLAGINAQPRAPLRIPGIAAVPQVKAELDELTHVIAGRLDVIGDPAGHAERVSERWERLDLVEHMAVGQPWRLIEAALAAAEHDPHNPKIWLDVAGWAVLAASLARQTQKETVNDPA